MAGDGCYRLMMMTLVKNELIARLRHNRARGIPLMTGAASSLMTNTDLVAIQLTRILPYPAR